MGYTDPTGTTYRVEVYNHFEKGCRHPFNGFMIAAVLPDGRRGRTVEQFGTDEVRAYTECERMNPPREPGSEPSPRELAVFRVAARSFQHTPKVEHAAAIVDAVARFPKLLEQLPGGVYARAQKAGAS